MNPARRKQDLRRHMRVPLRLVLLCIIVGIVAAFPASALAAPPSNDDFANAESPGGESTASASGTNVDATAEPPVELASTRDSPSEALYVALGDSVAVASGSYVDRLFPHYQSALGVTQLSNRSRSGETSGSIRTSGQLASALADINAPSDTRVVTINIGGNDLFDCADGWASCAFRSNLSATLSDLSAALDADPGPEALIVMAYYNPASGLGGEAPFSGEWWFERQLFGTDLVIDCEIAAGPRVGAIDVTFQEGRRHEALVADAYTAMKQGGQDFMAGSRHPNDAGQAAIADAFREASVPCITEGPVGESPPPDGTEPDTLAPTTVITKGPKGKTKRRKAIFRFRATEPSIFQCSLAGKKVRRKLRRWRACGRAQPARGGQQRYRRLRPGKKVFRVRATDQAGNVGKPAVREWRVMRRRR